ncbi:MAG TPA: SPOR domain-containing protein [Steroidobacter sp.]|uniref:SPOR domain-containing protein n=1 Tax=Steroidobacter sp. TaxID=1978227 RepID=UPI002ED85701
MERPVKERLIGAAVLMAAAIILIPEMLSGPGRDSAEQQAQATEAGEGGNDSPIKTYTIDLSQSPGAQPSMPVETTDNRAPPPEAAPPPETTPAPAEQPAPEPQVNPESQPVTPAETPAQRTPAPAPVAQTPRPEPRAETPPPAKPEPQKTEPRAVASAPAAPRSSPPTATGPTTGKGWAVQLGSYSSEATAQRLSNEWRAKGQSAFVMPVTAGGKTLYRVRIGPSKDRAGAESVLKAVKASIPSAAVVAHP